MQPPNQPPAWTPQPPMNGPGFGPPAYGSPGMFGPAYPPPKQTNVALIVGLVVGAFFLLLAGAGVFGFVVASREAKTPETFTSSDGLSEVVAPSSWSKHPHLNDRAVIQIANASSEEYLMVLTDSKEDLAADVTVDRYASLIVNQMKTGGTIKDVTITGPVPTEVGSRPAVRYEVEGTVEVSKIHYVITFVEGKTHYHQILAWTLKSRFPEKKQALLDASNTFREH